jgi:hypothetical protein
VIDGNNGITGDEEGRKKEREGRREGGREGGREVRPSPSR